MSKKTKQIDDLIRTILMSNPRIRFNVSDLYYEYKKRGGMLLSNERVQIKRAIERINDSRIKQEKEKNKLLFYYDSEETSESNIRKSDDQQSVEERFSEFEAQYIIDSILSCKSFSQVAKRSLVEKIFKNSNISEDFKETNINKFEKYEGLLDNTKSETKLSVISLLSENLENNIVEFDYKGDHITVFPWCLRQTQNGIVLRATKTEDFENEDFLRLYSSYKVDLISNVKKLQSQQIKRRLQNKEIDSHIANKGIDFNLEENGFCTLPYENVFLNLRKIRDAIKGKKKISFYYMPFLHTNTSKEPLKVSPIDCAFSNSKYMLFALNDCGDIKSFRVDFMDYITIEVQAVDKEIEKVNIAEHIIHHKKYEFVEITIPSGHLHKVYEEFGFNLKVEESNDQKEKRNYSEYKPSTKRLIKMTNGNLPDEFIENKDMLIVTIEDVNEEDVYRFALTHADVVKVISPPSLRARLINTARFMKNYNEKETAEDDQQWLNYYDAINRSILEYSKKESQKFRDICDIAQSEGQLLNITNVKLSGKDVENLDSIADLKGIEYLSIENTEIKSLGGLKGFNRLTQLILKNSPIENWEALKELPNLSFLTVIGIPTDIDILIKLRNLKQLTLNGTRIKNTSALLNNPQLPNLAFVYIDGKRYEKQ